MAKGLETESLTHSFHIDPHESCSMEHPFRLKSSEKVVGYRQSRKGQSRSAKMRGKKGV